jgi:hypothetical protein
MVSAIGKVARERQERRALLNNHSTGFLWDFMFKVEVSIVEYEVDTLALNH